MRILPIGLIFFGIIIIFNPAILAYLIGGFFIFIGLNLLIFFKGKKKKEDYVKFGNYKIFR